jgi:protein-disulfide isomerase
VLDQYQNKTKLVIKNFPTPNHQFAFMAATAALAAHKQNKFWQYHEKLLDNLDTLDDAKIWAFAAELGLNMDKFNADMQSPSIHGIIKRDIEDGLNAGVSGVPAIFVNGKILQDHTLQGLQQAIESELNKK